MMKDFSHAQVPHSLFALRRHFPAHATQIPWERTKEARVTVWAVTSKYFWPVKDTPMLSLCPICDWGHSLATVLGLSIILHYVLYYENRDPTMGDN